MNFACSTVWANLPGTNENLAKVAGQLEKLVEHPIRSRFLPRSTSTRDTLYILTFLVRSDSCGAEVSSELRNPTHGNEIDTVPAAAVPSPLQRNGGRYRAGSRFVHVICMDLPLPPSLDLPHPPQVVFGIFAEEEVVKFHRLLVSCMQLMAAFTFRRQFGSLSLITLRPSRYSRHEDIT